VNGVPCGVPVGDDARELVELGGAQDAVGHRRRADELLLSGLRREVPVGSAIRADDRKRDMVMHSRRAFGGCQILTRPHEEVPRVICSRPRRVGDVDHRIRRDEGRVESLTRHAVHSGARRCHDDRLGEPLQTGDDPPPDLPGATQHDNAHFVLVPPCAPPKASSSYQR
jgi:hypothetical protein